METIDVKKPIPNETGEQSGKSWHFWFLVVFSLLLIVTFIFYLPLRFQFTAQGNEEESPMIMEEQSEDHPHPEEIEEDHHLNLRNLFVGKVLANGEDIHEDKALNLNPLTTLFEALPAKITTGKTNVAKFVDC